MKIRFTVVAATCLSLLTGCVGSAAIGDGSGNEQSPGSAQQPEPSAAQFEVQCPIWSDPVADPEDGQLPAHELTCLGGQQQPVAMSGTPPRPTLINLWATWCGPCVEEIPILDEFAAQASGKVDVLGVVTSDSESAAVEFALANEMSFPSVLDPDGIVAGVMALQAIPNSILVDSSGMVAAVHIGAFTSLQQIVALVEDELAVAI